MTLVAAVTAFMASLKHSLDHVALCLRMLDDSLPHPLSNNESNLNCMMRLSGKMEFTFLVLFPQLETLSPDCVCYVLIGSVDSHN